jgi:hypothetical protein
MMNTTRRDQSLDLLRGLMLVIITINHTNGPFHRYTFQTFGYFSAAEGFVFLSGILLGLVNGRRLSQSPLASVKKTVFKRSRTIYFYHLATIFIITSPWLFSGITGIHRLPPSLTSFSEHPLESFFCYALLLNQPSFLDILPMYVLFIFLGYFILAGFYYGKQCVVLLISTALWLLSQFDWNVFFDVNLKHIPSIHFGSFNPFSWQILFTLGCYLGYCKATGKNIIPTHRWITAVSLSVIVVFLAAKLLRNSQPLISNLLTDFTDRDNLGPFRLINFAAAVYLVSLAIEKGPKLRSWWLETLGQHSLQVFTFQVILVYFSTPLMEDIKPLGSHYQVLMQLVIIAALIIPALLHKYLQKKLHTLRWQKKVALLSIAKNRDK